MYPVSHVKASFSIFNCVEEPKIKGVCSGYSPHHKLEGSDFLVSGVHLYKDLDLHYPGETLEVRIAFPCWDFIKSEFFVGKRFEVFELDRLIGGGEVLEVLNE